MNKNQVKNLLFENQYWHDIANEYKLDSGKYLKRTKDFLDILPPTLSANSTVLDMGTGSGWFSILLRMKLGCTTYAIDLQIKELLKKNFETLGINYRLCDITKERLPFPDDHFDAVFFMEVLEHLITRHPPYDIFREIRRILKDGGWLIMSTPNALCISNRLTLLKGTRPPSISYTILGSNVEKGETLQYFDHIREFSAGELYYVLAKTGYETVDLIFTHHSPAPKGFFGYCLHFLEKLYPNFRNTIIITSRVSKP